MAPTIDLKPLSEETIQEMGYSNHDLWVVKIDSVIYGPFETESLKHYVHDNEVLFENAEVSRNDETEWKPFWEHTRFEKTHSHHTEEKSEQKFWIMDLGRVAGPLSFRDIDKKIEMGLLSLTDHISFDEGETWIKIHEIEGFNNRTHSPEELPRVPTEASFQKARLKLMEKMDQPHFNTVDEIAELAWQIKEAPAIPLKILEMPVPTKKTTEVSHAFKWMAPTAIGLVLMLAVGGHMLMNDTQTETPIELAEDTPKPFKKKRVASNGRLSGTRANFRNPASVPPIPRRNFNEPFRSAPQFPTHIETHSNSDEGYQEAPVEPMVETAEGIDQPAQEEHSLVQNDIPLQEDQSLDATMGADPQPVPEVEQVNDF